MPTKKTGSVVATPMFPDELPRLVQDAIVHSAISGNDMSQNIVGATLQSIKFGATKYLNYGTNTYVHGLPTVQVGAYRAHADHIQETIAQQYDLLVEDVNVIGINIRDEVNNYFAAEYWLKENYDSYDPSDGYMYKISSTVPDGDGGTTTSNTNVYFDYYEPSASYPDRLKIFSTEKYEGYAPIPAAGNTFYVVAWQVEGNTTDTFYWMYDTTSNDDPVLSALSEVGDESDYFPIIPVRNRGRTVTKPEESFDLTFYGQDFTVTNEFYDELLLEYKQSKRALQLINLDLDTIAGSIDDNPDIDSIDGAYVMFAMDIYTKNEASIKYLLEYFAALRPIMPLTKPIQLGYRATGVYSDNQLVFREQSFDMKVLFAFIEEETVNDSIGDVGTYASVFQLESGPYGDGKVLVFREQLTETTVRQVLVHNPIHQYEVRLWGEPGNSDYEPAYFIKELEEPSAEDPEHSGFVIPMSDSTIKLLKGKERGDALYTGLHSVVYAVQSTHLEWYETEVFLNLITIIGIGLSVFTAGQSIIAAAAISASAVALTILSIYLVSVVIDYATQWLYENVGGVFAVILAVVVTIAIGDFAGGNFAQLSHADKLVKIATVTSDSYVANEVVEFKESALEHEKWDKEQSDAYTKASDLLDLFDQSQDRTELYYEAMMSRPVYARAGESPENFINRTVNMTNIAQISLDMVNNYHALARTVPLPQPITDAGV